MPSNSRRVTSGCSGVSRNHSFGARCTVPWRATYKMRAEDKRERIWKRGGNVKGEESSEWVSSTIWWVHMQGKMNHHNEMYWLCSIL